MATTKIGAMRIDIGADSAQFDKAMSDVQRNLAKVGAKFEAIGAKTADWGKKLSVGLTLPIVGMAAAAVKGAQDQAAAMAQVEAAIGSMGNAAGLSGQQLSAFADKLEMSSLFDADQILKESTANLLTFGNIAGESFKKAQQAAVDLATRMDGDLQGATLMVGKALNDPIKGLTALSRAGIQFTDQQKAQIKAMQEGGNMAGAQAIMLAELNKQFGGAGAAAAKADPMRAVMVQLGKAGDIIGEKLLPILPGLADKLVAVLETFTNLSPAVQEFVIIGGGIAAALGPALIGIGGMVSGFGKMVPLLEKLGPLFTKLGPIIWTATKALAAMALTPVGAVIVGIAAAVTAVYLAWKNWDKITAFVANLYNGVKTWLGDKLGAVFDWLGKKITAVGDWFFKLYDRVVGHSYIPDMVDEIGQHMARLQGNMVDPTAKATQTTAEKFRDMAGQISGVMDSLYPEIAALRAELASLALLEGDPNTPLDAIMRQRQRVADAQGRATAEASPALERPDATLPGELVGLPGVPMPVPALEQMNELGLALRDTFDRMGGKTGEALANITDGLLNAVIPALFRTQAQAEAAGASLAQMGQGLTSLFTGIFGKKAGGILGAIGTIGLKIAGFREKGGPVSAGNAYVVGEKRPEVFVPNVSGSIIPDMSAITGAGVSSRSYDGYVGAGGHMRERETRILVQVQEGALFRPVVTQIAGGVAAPMAAQAAAGGSLGAQTAIMRKQSRRLA